MAAAAPTFSQITQNHNNSNNTTITNIHEVNREEIQAAIAKAVELRALHAALMQRNIPSNLTYPSSSSVSHPVSQFSAQDYPVFTPSYEEVPLPGYRQFRMESGPLSGNWDCYELEGGNGDETILSDYKEEISSSKKGLPSCFVSLDSHICPAEDEKYVHGCSADDITVLQASPRTDFLRSSRRNSLGDFKSVSSYCNKCKPAIISSESDNAANNSKSSNIVVPLSDSHSSAQSHSKDRGMNFSWLFPRIKKKHKNENSPTRTDSEEMSQISKDFGMMPIETLQKQLIEVNKNRDAALMEVSEMRSSLGELKQKYECLETYCEDLKKALGQAAQANHLQVQERLGNPTRRGNSIDGHSGNLMPFSEEVMVECFLQIVSESRLSVKHFCKILVGQIEETDSTLMKNLDLVLQPHNLSLNSKYSKAVLYHLEAIISQQLYQDFENCVFQKNGSPKILDPQQERQAQYSSFVALRNLSWNEVLRKGTKYYSEEFSKFCDQKMSCIISTLNWTRPWPEQLLQAFFVAAKCIWLLHLLAFSFNPPLGILRVEENRSFDSNYMEDVFMEQQRSHGPTRVKIMVMPGFYVLDRVLRCKVLCKYKSVD